ncbi:MAG: 50S ribosomal protein L9 [Patescibacteria group bacterium]|nr:50S ribosomal protein L9 [Patescibacteria group bacterium]
MKVIFLENLNEFKVGDIKNVPDGYARNFLIPRGIAEIATESKIKELETKIEKIKKDEEQRVSEANKLAERISGLKIILTEEVNEEGHLYGAITAKEISEALSKNGIEIEPANIIIEEPIKELGESEIVVKVGHGVESTLKISVKRK